MTVFHRDRLSRGIPNKQVWNFTNQNDYEYQLKRQLLKAELNPKDMYVILKEEQIFSQNDKK